MKEKIVAIIQDKEDGTKILFRHEDDMIKLAQKMYKENEGEVTAAVFPTTLLLAKKYIHHFCDKWNVFFKSKEAFDIIFAERRYPYGAPKGRFDVGVKPTDKKVFNRYVPFIDSAYDPGGVYWGLPANLRVEYSEDLQYIHYYRSY